MLEILVGGWLLKKGFEFVTGGEPQNSAPANTRVNNSPGQPELDIPPPNFNMGSYTVPGGQPNQLSQEGGQQGQFDPSGGPPAAYELVQVITGRADRPIRFTTVALDTVVGNQTQKLRKQFMPVDDDGRVLTGPNTFTVCSCLCGKQIRIDGAIKCSHGMPFAIGHLASKEGKPICNCMPER